MSRTWALVSVGTPLAGLTTTVTPSTAKGKDISPYLATSASESARPVLPMALSYWAADGQRSLAPRYDGDISLGACVRAILSQRGLSVRLVTTPLLGGAGEDRKQVTQAARHAILTPKEDANGPG